MSSSRRGCLQPATGGRFAAVVFDMGSTLIEFENVSWPVLFPISLASLRQRLEQMGKTVPDQEVIEERFFALLERRRAAMRTEMREYRIGELLRSLCRSLRIALGPGELTRLVDAYYAPIRRQLTVYPDAESTLVTLKTAGYKIGLLSNTCFRVRDHREELMRFKLWDHFDAAAFTSTGVFRKPHPAPFRRIAAQLGVLPEQCLYVGDRQYEDVQGPQGVGMGAVLVRRPHRPYEPGLTDSAEVYALGELPALLDC